MAFSFFGGVHPLGHKALTCDCAAVPFVPKQVVIPMSQHIGAPCQPMVKKGDPVTVGQKIGDNTGLCVPVHASVSGKVLAVEPRPTAGGTNAMCVVIENDMLDTVCPELAPCNPEDMTAEALMDKIHQAGISGMGGATFPTHVKLSSGIGKVDTVIINAAECEPYITADDRLMRETPERLFGGLRILLKIFGLEKGWIGIEDNKPEALQSLKTCLAGAADAEILVCKTRYPQGAEKQLIQTVTGRQVPPGGLPADVGCAVFNAATAAAVYDAVTTGMPLVRRILTVTGNAVRNPMNFSAPIGTPFCDLIEAAGGFRTDAWKVLSGGPMMGVAQHDLSVPTSKGTNAITCIAGPGYDRPAEPSCIHCGKCAEVCPMHLLPVFLYEYERLNQLDKLDRMHVTDCIECGSCAFTCPAGIPLVQSFKTGKQKLRDAAAKKNNR